MTMAGYFSSWTPPTNLVDCEELPPTERKSALAEDTRTGFTTPATAPNLAWVSAMISVLVAAPILLCLGFLLRRYRARERRSELLMLKRHAANYAEQDERL